MSRYNDIEVGKVISTLQTSTSHEGMRLGVPVSDVLEALTKGEAGKTITMATGDIRRMYRSERCSVVVSLRDNKIIQTNPG